MDLSFLVDLEPGQLRRVLATYLAAYIDDPTAEADTRTRLEDYLAGLSPEVLAGMVDHLGTLGQAHRVYLAEPHCRQISRLWCRDVVREPECTGVTHLREALAAGPTVIFCNHLAYVDTIAFDFVLAVHGHAELADRVVTVAGPKVYADLFRRFAAAALSTLPVPQSTQLEHTAHLPARELARRAQQSVDAAREALGQGLALQLYPEGSRTRTGRLGPFLRGVHRYLSAPGLRVVPAAITGTDAMFPIGAARIHPNPVRLAFGTALDVEGLGGPKASLPAAHGAVSALLPPALKPDPQAPTIR